MNKGTKVQGKKVKKRKKGTKEQRNNGTKEQRNKGTKKITQPCGTKRNHTTCQDKKKKCNLLRQKLSRNLSGQNFFATSWDEKNHAMQPLGTKSRNLLGHKKIHATSWDK